MASLSVWQTFMLMLIGHRVLWDTRGPGDRR